LKILNIGSLNIDFVYKVKNFLMPGETMTANSLKVLPGGKGLNQSIAIKRAGVSVYHCGNIGNDGELLYYTLLQEGIIVDYIKKDKEKCGHAMIQVNDVGENMIVVFSGANRQISKEHINMVLSNFSIGDIVLMQGETNNIDFVINEAYKKGLRIIINLAPISDRLLNLDFSKVDTLIVNRVELSQIAKTDDIEEGIKRLKKLYNLNLLVTLGKNGGIYIDSNGKRFEYDSFDVEAIDTTGAGDTFIGYFISGLYKNTPLEENLKTASAAAALCVSVNGSSAAVPTFIEVQKFIDNYRKDKLC